MGSYMGVSEKARKDTKGYFGVEGKARKVVKGYIGDALGKARLWFSSALPGSGKLGIHFRTPTASAVHDVMSSDDGVNFNATTVTMPTAVSSHWLSYVRRINRWVLAHSYITSDDKLNGVLTYVNSPYTGKNNEVVVDGYRFKTTDNSVYLTVYRINADLSETQIGTVALITSFPSYGSWFNIDVASDGNGTFCCGFYVRGERTTSSSEYDYDSNYVSFVVLTISGDSVVLQKSVRNTTMSSSAIESYIPPTVFVVFSGSGFLVYGNRVRYNQSTDVLTASNHRLYYVSNASPYSEATVTLPTFSQSDAEFSPFQSRANDEYIYCTDGYKYYRKNKTNGAFTDITSTLKVTPRRSDGDYLYGNYEQRVYNETWSISRAKPGDAAATVVTVSTPTSENDWGWFAYKDQGGTYQQY